MGSLWMGSLVHRKESAVVLATWVLMVFAAAPGFGQQTQALGADPDLDAIVSRMEDVQAENRLHTPAYNLTRDYRLFGSDEQQLQSKVIAEIYFVPPNAKTFKIDTVEGNDRGKTIVQHILNSEAAASKNQPSAAISRLNYDFSLQGGDVIDGHPCWILRLQPKREEKSLITGSAWVDKTSYRVRRIEGDMAKSPSWWVKRVHVTAIFADVSGVWLQTDTEATADVRLIGRHVLVGHVVKLETATQVTYLAPAPQAWRIFDRPRKASPILGFGFVAR
jgi:hypothetical protein